MPTDAYDRIYEIMRDGFLAWKNALPGLRESGSRKGYNAQDLDQKSVMERYLGLFDALHGLGSI